MTRVLDPRFALILDFMDGASTNLERAIARENAEAMALASGFTYAEALAELRRPTAPAIGAPLSSFVVIEPEPGAPDEHASHVSTRDAAIAEALAADPSRSDRDVARLVGCSPTTVGRARAAAGLARGVRVVNRRGRSYEMRVGSLGGGTSAAD